MASRRILITGASRGIGRGCALALAQAGADIVVNFFGDADEAEETANQVRALGQRVMVHQADVSRLDQVEEMVARVVNEWGGIDGLISNAAFSDREPMLEADMDGFRRTIDVCMWGAMHSLLAVSRQLVQQGTGGSIIIMSSPHADIPFPGTMAYNMAKAAIDQMARTAAMELVRHRIRINLIHPGWIDTPGERKFFTEDQLQAGGAALPWQRLGTSEEIGRLAAFMMSEDCDYMTGSTVLMDGGITLPWWSKRSEGKP